MDEQEFLAAVERRTEVESSDEAFTVADATLETLGERVVEGEAEDLAAQLPEGLAGSVTTGTEEAESFDAEEFLDRVASRETERGDLEDPDAQRHVRATTEVLGKAVSGGEVEDVRAELPEEFEPLFEAVDASRRQS